MDGETNPVDAEMEAIFNEGAGTPDLTGQAPPAEATPTPSSWKAGGREWKDPSELAKAHDAMVREYSRVKNEVKPLEEWKRFGSYLDQHPELRKELSSRIEEYQKKRSEGQSKSQAQAGSQIPPEVAQKLERLEAQQATYTLEREMNSVRGKYKLNDSQMREVLQYAEEHGRNGLDLPLDLAYRSLYFDKQRGEVTGEVKAEMAKKKAANVGGSSAPGITVAPKNGSWSNNKEWQSSLGSQMDKLGIE